MNRIKLENYEKLVYYYAHRFSKKRKYRLNHDDVTNCGFVGLIKAKERYDPTKGASFATYSSYWINCEMFKYEKEELKMNELYKLDIDNKINEMNELYKLEIDNEINEMHELYKLEIDNEINEMHELYKLEIDNKINEINDKYLNNFESNLIRLKYEDNLTYKQIGTMYGLSKYKLKKKYDKIYKTLKIAYKEENINNKNVWDCIYKRE
jgi:RNA polymerase sigma factor (sigma-70 family)